MPLRSDPEHRTKVRRMVLQALGLNAANAFKDQNELIGFVESINKQFAIGGTEASAAAGAMTQLTQAMGSGALRGDELNSVLEAAPSIARNIEKYMGWAEGSIKSYAEKGALSAEIVKNAQLAAMDDIDRKFNSMPLTWSQLWTQSMNAIQKASAPFLLALNWIANNMDIIGPILLGIAAGLGVYAGVYLRGGSSSVGTECSNRGVECFVYDESGGIDGNQDLLL